MLEQLAFHPTENTEEINLKQLDGFQDVIGFFSLLHKVEKRIAQQVVNVQEENTENDRHSNTHNSKVKIPKP